MKNVLLSPLFWIHTVALILQKKKIRKIVTLKGFKVWKLKNFKTALILREIDSRDSDRF